MLLAGLTFNVNIYYDIINKFKLRDKKCWIEMTIHSSAMHSELIIKRLRRR